MKKQNTEEHIYYILPFALLKDVFICISSLLKNAHKKETADIGFLRGNKKGQLGGWGMRENDFCIV